MDQRRNTIKVQLPSQNEKPLDAEMLRWVILDLELKDEEIVGVGQNPANDGVMYIKCVSEAKMREVIEKYDGTLFKYLNGIAVRVTMTEASENIRYVRIFGLPFEVEDEHIESFFRSFGIVKRLVKEKYPAHYNFHVLSGVRGVYIDLKREIPAFLHMRGVRVKIHYYGMKAKCHICGSLDHMKSECPSKPMPIVTPTARLNVESRMQNLNALFKKPFGEAQINVPLSGGVTPGQSFAKTLSGVTIEKESNENQVMIQQQSIVSTVDKSTQPVVVTVTNTDLDSRTDVSPKTNIDVAGKVLLSMEVGEENWRRVRRSGRSRSKNVSPAKMVRVRTESSSSATSTTSTRGRGRPKKNDDQMIIQYMATNDGQPPDNDSEVTISLPDDIAN
jgi:Zinc knuckle